MSDTCDGYRGSGPCQPFVSPPFPASEPERPHNPHPEKSGGPLMKASYPLVAWQTTLGAVVGWRPRHTFLAGGGTPKIVEWHFSRGPALVRA
jgi:hypothetical protein